MRLAARAGARPGGAVIGDNGEVSEQGAEPGPGAGQAVEGPTGAAGKRAGSRKGAKPPGRRRPAVLGYTVGIILAVAAWGYLVWAAVDFGSQARDGDDRAWWFLGLAALGAVACLFVGLMLIARLARTLRRGSRPSSPASPTGGKRAAR
jgi:hypothetical protein